MQTKKFICGRVNSLRKTAGTSCFFIESDVWEFLNECEEIVKPYGVTPLPEIHEHYTMQERIAEKDYFVYDFTLPMLLIHALYYGQTQYLKNWLNICPRKQFTTLDTHDGIGVVDVKDLLPDEEIDRKNGDEWAKLNADFAKKTFEVIYSENGGEKILNY